MKEEQVSNIIEIDTKVENYKTNICESILKFDNIPDHIIQNEIFSYLNSNDLFMNCRGVSINWSEMIKNVWSTKIKEEMIDQVKSIDFIYEKEVLTKTYEFKLSYLINYKNLLTAYNNNANILLILFNLVQHLEDAEVKNLVTLFFSFINLQYALEYVQENQLETLKNYLTNDDNYIYFKIKILEMMIIEDNIKEMSYLIEIKNRFSLLNKDYLENISDFAKLIYSFLQGMVEYQILKVEVRELKEKIENLLKKLKETSKIWPKKKKFLEKAYKLIIFNKNSTPQIRNIIMKFEEYKIRHPLIDYNDECIKSILDLRKYLLNTPPPKINDNQYNDNNLLSDLGNENPIEEKIFENICSRRILLTKKLLIIERFAELYQKCVSKNDFNKFIVNDINLSIKEFLWCLKISANSKEENVTEISILRTKTNLDKNFDYENHIIYSIPRRMRLDNIEYERKTKEEEEINLFDNNYNENNDNNHEINEKLIKGNNSNHETNNDEEKEIMNSLSNELEKYDFLVKLSNNYHLQNNENNHDNDNQYENVYCCNCQKKQIIINENNQNEDDIEKTNINNGFNMLPCNTQMNSNKHIQSHNSLLEDKNLEFNENNNHISTQEQNKFLSKILKNHENYDNQSEIEFSNNNNTIEENRPLAYGNNIRRDNINFNKKYDYKNPELEEEVNQAEHIVSRLISGRTPNDQELISVLESKEAEVNRLRIEKDKLILRKQKTEQVLDMLKKFITLKDNMMNNKRYYRAILYLLDRVRRNENKGDDSLNLAQIINSGELEEIINLDNFETYFPDRETHEDLDNFKQLDELIKEIEIELLKQVNDIFGENSNNNNDNINN